MAKDDVLIMGEGTCIEGKYNKVRIMGSGQLEGNIKSNKFTIAGSVEGRGNINFEELKVAGAIEIEGSLKGKKLRIAGAGEIQGSIKVDTCKIYGMLDIEEDLEAEEVILRGGLESNGYINSETVFIQLLGPCQVEGIGASNIKIGKNVTLQNEKGLKRWFNSKMLVDFGDKEGYFIGKEIEGDRIYVDTAQVQVIRGEHVEIGPDCQIDKVEYSQFISIDKGSKVGEIVQITAGRKG
nr:hypothetical protein [uncultured Niameybacter sp.]